MFPIHGLISVLFLVTPVMAQRDQSTGQLLSIHEDHVIPSMAAQYETAIKSLRDQLTKHRISNIVLMAVTILISEGMMGFREEKETARRPRWVYID